jgi:sterol desaturase/sphingolipid hydroxylase (fatty acid hydroxylase superfamily)
MEAFVEWLRDLVPAFMKPYYWAALNIYTNPLFYGGVVVILVIEVLRPAIKEQRVFSRSLAQDFLWFNAGTAFKVAALPAFLALLQAGYDRITGGYTVQAWADWPGWLRASTAFLINDFLQWFHHWVRHKVRPFWHFHVVHHSQREMNLFTDLRVHSVEYMISLAITIVPLLAFQLSVNTIMGIGVLMIWYTRLYHANIRSNFGPLKYVLVTPQSHRIHHSIEPRHRDRNFGVILTVWDRMFGTLYPSYDEYPRTGVEGVEFRTGLRGFFTEFLYPFRMLARPGRQ